jgi:hypothetical protein
MAPLAEGWLLYPLLYSSLTLKLTEVKGALTPQKAFYIPQSLAGSLKVACLRTALP